MSEAIIVALITGALSLAGVIISVRHSQKETLAALDKKSELSDARMDAKLEKHMAVTDTKIDELTREVRRHNGFAERIPVLEEKIKVANNRILNLEKGGAGGHAEN